MLLDLLRLIRLSRLFDAAFPTVSIFLGAAVTDQLNNRDLFLLFIVVVILNSIAMVWNDIEDRQVDADNGRPELVNSSATSLHRLKMCILFFASVSLLLSWLVNITAFILAIASLGVIWAYNSKPFQVSRRPIVSIFTLSGAGALLPYLFGLSLGSIAVYMLIAGLFWWLGRISLSVLKDYKDARGDARHQKKTFLLCYGAHKVAWVSIISLIIGYAGFIIIMYPVSSKMWVLPALVAAVGTLIYMRRTLFNSKATYNQFDSVFRRVAQYQLLLDVGVVIWLA